MVYLNINYFVLHRLYQDNGVYNTEYLASKVIMHEEKNRILYTIL